MLSWRVYTFFYGPQNRNKPKVLWLYLYSTAKTINYSLWFTRQNCYLEYNPLKCNATDKDTDGIIGSGMQIDLIISDYCLHRFSIHLHIRRNNRKKQLIHCLFSSISYWGWWNSKSSSHFPCSLIESVDIQSCLPLWLIMFPIQWKRSLQRLESIQKYRNLLRIQVLSDSFHYP